MSEQLLSCLKDGGTFAASNGQTAQHTGSGVGFASGYGYIGPEAHTAATEYYQALRDEELGRWRSPSHPRMVCYAVAPNDGVRVLNEDDGRSRIFGRDVDLEIIGSSHRIAAVEYFDAHPIVKPWHDAKPGEVWALSRDDGIERLHLVDDDGDFLDSSGVFIRSNASMIKSGRRIDTAVEA